MENLQRDIGCVGGRDKRIGHGRKGDAHPARRRTGDPGKHGHADGFVEQRVRDSGERFG